MLLNAVKQLLVIGVTLVAQFVRTAISALRRVSSTGGRTVAPVALIA